MELFLLWFFGMPVLTMLAVWAYDTWRKRPPRTTYRRRDTLDGHHRGPDDDGDWRRTLNP